MKQIPDIVIYGETDCNICPRAGSISFNIKGMHHGLTAAILNDYFNIAVRNECFCAHPYVKEMILDDMLVASESMTDEELENDYKLIAGMVRASFGIYNTSNDVDALIDALKEVVSRKDELTQNYHVDASPDYVHNTFEMDAKNRFSVPEFVDQYMTK
jgi:selenocysteine lyase/cysteine desulfurase